MAIVNIKQMQKIDGLAIEKYGVPSICLMENAGRSVAEQIRSLLKDIKNPKVCIFCGVGNNAGDGFVVARHLVNARVLVDVYLIGGMEQLKTDALVNYRILKKCKYPISNISRIDKVTASHISNADLFVDALFGTGLNREIQEPFKGIIEFLNSSKKPVVSIDIPSGLNGTTGEIYGVCVKAFSTITFEYEKKGFFKKHGPAVTGKVVVVDIGIPKNIIKEI